MWDAGIAWKFARKANTLWPGAIPEARRDFGVILTPNMGVAPGHKMFFHASALLVVFIGLFLGFQVLVRHRKWNLERNHWWNERFRGRFHFRLGFC